MAGMYPSCRAGVADGASGMEKSRADCLGRPDRPHQGTCRKRQFTATPDCSELVEYGSELGNWEYFAA